MCYTITNEQANVQMLKTAVLSNFCSEKDQNSHVLTYSLVSGENCSLISQGDSPALWKILITFTVSEMQCQTHDCKALQA